MCLCKCVWPIKVPKLLLLRFFLFFSFYPLIYPAINCFSIPIKEFFNTVFLHKISKNSPFPVHFVESYTRRPSSLNKLFLVLFFELLKKHFFLQISLGFFSSFHKLLLLFCWIIFNAQLLYAMLFSLLYLEIHWYFTSFFLLNHNLFITFFSFFHFSEYFSVSLRCFFFFE